MCVHHFERVPPGPGTSVRYASDRATIYVVVQRVPTRTRALIVTYSNSSIVLAPTLPNLFNPLGLLRPLTRHVLQGCSARRGRRSKRDNWILSFDLTHPARPGFSEFPFRSSIGMLLNVTENSSARGSRVSRDCTVAQTWPRCAHCPEAYSFAVLPERV